MQSPKGKRTATSVVVLGLLVVVATGWSCRERLKETCWIHLLQWGNEDQKFLALAGLLNINSIRAAPYLARHVLDPSLHGILSPAIHMVQGEKKLESVEPDKGAHQFEGLSLLTLNLISSHDFKPVVEFYLPRNRSNQEDALKAYEGALEDALQKASPRIQIQALAILLRIRAPASVHLQCEAIQRLKRLKIGGEWASVLSIMETRFFPEGVMKEIQADPAAFSYLEKHEYFWSLRAAGVLQLWAALPRLKELSVSDDLDTALVAERSLEDFEGSQGDQALVHCLLGWKYDVFVRAANALLKRNKVLLSQTLSNTVAPRDWRYWQGIFLARCEHPAAVHLLCSSPRVAIMERGLYEQIRRLASKKLEIPVQEIANFLEMNLKESRIELSEETHNDIRELDTKRRIVEDLYLKKLQSGILEEMKDALFQLRRLRSSRTLPALVKVLQDPHAEIRGLAALSLAWFGPDAKPAVPALALLLKDPSKITCSCCCEGYPVGCQAAMALGGIGPEARDAVPALRKALKGGDPRLRYEAALAIAEITLEMALEDIGLLEVLVGELKEHGEEYRSDAILALAKLGLPVPDALRIHEGGFGRVSFSPQSISEFVELSGKGGR